MKYYQAHNEKFSTSSATPLDDDANRLGLTLSGNCNLPAKYLEIFEKQCRDNIRLLSHADIFSFAALKCLQQEKMDPKILSRILESLSSSIKDAIGLSTFTAIGLQQVRREAAIRAAPRSLTDQAKKRLRKIHFASQSLFCGKVDEFTKKTLRLIEVLECTRQSLIKPSLRILPFRSTSPNRSKENRWSKVSTFEQ